MERWASSTVSRLLWLPAGRKVLADAEDVMSKPCSAPAATMKAVHRRRASEGGLLRVTIGNGCNDVLQPWSKRRAELDDATAVHIARLRAGRKPGREAPTTLSAKRTTSSPTWPRPPPTPRQRTAVTPVLIRRDKETDRDKADRREGSGTVRSLIPPPPRKALKINLGRTP